MAYFGNEPADNFTAITKDTFSGDGSTTAFTLTNPATTNGVQVFVENVRQEPTSAYTVSNTTLTFTAAPVTGTDNIYVVNSGTPVSTATHPAGAALQATTGTFSSDVSTEGDVKVTVSSGGTYTITGTDTSTDRTLTLPDEAGTVLTSGGAIDVDASAPADSIAIDSSGNVGIGTASPTNPLHVLGGSNAESAVIIDDTNVGGGRKWGLRPGLVGVNNGYLSIFDETASATRMYITDVGAINFNEDFAVGRDSTASFTGGAGLKVDKDGTGSGFVATDSGSTGPLFYFVNNAATVTNGYRYVTFRATSGFAEVGTISTNGTTSTSYNTSSDYRLKENVVEMTGAIDRVKQLRPSQFNFIVDPDTTVDGFIAHEAQAVVPESVTGQRDAVDENGDPIYQGIDQSKLVPLLTGALKEAIAKIETLETTVADLQTRVTALETP